MDLVDKAPKQVICNSEILAYQVLKMATLSAELVTALKFEAYKQIFGIDLPLSQCVFANIKKEQKQKFKDNCNKTCNVEFVKNQFFFYSNAVLVNVVSWCIHCCLSSCNCSFLITQVIKIFEEQKPTGDKFRPFTICSFQAVNNLLTILKDILIRKTPLDYCVAVQSAIYATTKS